MNRKWIGLMLLAAVMVSNSWGAQTKPSLDAETSIENVEHYQNMLQEKLKTYKSNHPIILGIKQELRKSALESFPIILREIKLLESDYMNMVETIRSDSQQVKSLTAKISKLRRVLRNMFEYLPDKDKYECSKSLWDFAECVQKYWHKLPVKELDFSSDSRKIILASEIGTAKNVVVVRDVLSGKKLSSFKLGDGNITSVALSPDGESALTATSHSKNLILWDTQTGQQITKFVVDFYILDTAFSHDGRYILAGGGFKEYGEACVWDKESGKMLGRPIPACPRVSFVSFYPDDSKFIVTDDDITIYDTKIRQSVQGITYPGVSKDPQGNVVFSKDGRYLASELGIWDMNTFEKVKVIEHLTPGDFIPDCDIFVGLTGSYVLLWDIKSSKEIAKFDCGSNIRSASVSPDGLFVLTGHDDGANLWYIGKVKNEVILKNKNIRVPLQESEIDTTKLIETEYFVETQYFERPHWSIVMIDVELANISDKTITGIMYEMKFTDSFGDILHQTRDKLFTILNPQKVATINFSYRDDIDEEKDIYKKLYDPAKEGQLKVEIDIIKVILQ